MFEVFDLLNHLTEHFKNKRPEAIDKQQPGNN